MATSEVVIGPLRKWRILYARNQNLINTSKVTWNGSRIMVIVVYSLTLWQRDCVQ